MVEMENDRDLASELLRVLRGTACHIAEYVYVRIVPCALRYLKDNWALCLHAGLDYSLHLLHIVEVVSRDRILALHGLREDLPAVHQSEFLVACHLRPP